VQKVIVQKRDAPGGRDLHRHRHRRRRQHHAGHPAGGDPGRPRAKQRVVPDPGPRPRTAGSRPARTAGAPEHRPPEHHRAVRTG
jgi:hypothetical protein